MASSAASLVCVLRRQRAVLLIFKEIRHHYKELTNLFHRSAELLVKCLLWLGLVIVSLNVETKKRLGYSACDSKPKWAVSPRFLVRVSCRIVTSRIHPPAANCRRERTLLSSTPRLYWISLISGKFGFLKTRCFFFNYSPVLPNFVPALLNCVQVIAWNPLQVVTLHLTWSQKFWDHDASPLFKVTGRDCSQHWVRVSGRN